MDLSRVFPKAEKSAVSSAFSLRLIFYIELRVQVGETSVVSYCHCARRYVPLLRAIVDIDIRHRTLTLMTGSLKCFEADKARPINIVHVIGPTVAPQHCH